MSELEIKSLLRESLVNDQAKTLDKAVWKQFGSGLLIVQADGGTSTTAVQLESAGSATTACVATAALNTAHIEGIVDLMKERNIPTFDGESYVAIAHPSTFANIRSSMIAANVYTDSAYRKRMSGEVGMYAGMRFIEQTNIAKVSPTNAGKGQGWAVFVGGEACVEAVSVPEELIEKEVTDYGRSLGLAWYATLGFKLPFSTAANQRHFVWWPNISSPNSLVP